MFAQVHYKFVQLTFTPSWIFNPFNIRSQRNKTLSEFLAKIDPLAEFKDEITTSNNQFILKRQEIQNTQGNIPHFMQNFNDKMQRILLSLVTFLEKAYNDSGRGQLYSSIGHEIIGDIKNLLCTVVAKHSSVEQVFAGLERCLELTTQDLKKATQKSENFKSLAVFADTYKTAREKVWQAFGKKLLEYFGELPCDIVLSNYQAKLEPFIEQVLFKETIQKNLQDYKTFENTIYKDLESALAKYFPEGLVMGFDEERLGGRENLLTFFTIVLTTDYSGTQMVKTANILMLFYNKFVAPYVDQNNPLSYVMSLFDKSQDNYWQRHPDMETYLLNAKQTWKLMADYHQNLYAMIALFLNFNFLAQTSIENCYTPQTRYMLKCAFRNLKDGDIQFSNYQILCCLECLIEAHSQTLQVIEMDQMVPIRKNVIKTIRTTKVKSLNDHEKHMTQMQVFNNYFNPQLAQPKKFFFESLSQPKAFSKSLTICISGFTSEDCLKSEEWEKMAVAFPYSEIIALNWNSGTAKKVLNSAWNALMENKDEVFSGKGFFGKLVTGAIMANKVANSVKDDVWGEAYKEAIVTGTYLANLIGGVELFKGYCINFVGFSLGTLVIETCIKELAKIKRDDIVFDVVLMGGVANRNIWTHEVLEVINHKLINCYCLKDQVLLGAFKVAHPDIMPVGLGEIVSDLAKVENYNVTELASGHLEYRASLTKILETIGFNEDFRYLLK